MPSRQDQLHSYQFMIQRVVAALVMRDTDPAQSPFRRAMGATVASVLIAAIVLAGTAAWAFLRGSSAKNWKKQAQSAVVVEKETGARYVFRNGVLHPVLNFTSGALLVGGARTVNVSAKALEGEPRGATYGIPDAPDSLPRAGRLAPPVWTVCSATGAVGADALPTSVLSVGREAVGGTALRGRAVLVQNPSGTFYLLTDQRRHKVRNRTLLQLVGNGVQQPPVVSQALLNTIEVGDPIAKLRIRDRGKESDVVKGHRNGEAIVVGRGQANRYYVVLDDGLAPITGLQLDLLVNDPEYRDFTGLSRDALDMDLADAHRYARDPLTRSGPGSPPAAKPDFVDATTGALCMTLDHRKHDNPETQSRTGIWVGATLPDVAAVPKSPGSTGRNAVLADHVLLTAGTGALVEVQPAPGVAGGAVLLVTDHRKAYALSSPEVRKMLGYAAVQPMPVPGGVSSLIPAGAGLDPELAEKPVTAEEPD